MTICGALLIGACCSPETGDLFGDNGGGGSSATASAGSGSPELCEPVNCSANITGCMCAGVCKGAILKTFCGYGNELEIATCTCYINDMQIGTCSVIGYVPTQHLTDQAESCSFQEPGCCSKFYNTNP